MIHGATPSGQEIDHGPNISQISRQGYAFLKQELLGEAIICFRQILEAEPDNNYALVGIGDSYRKKRRFHEAASYYQRCLQTHPSNNYALFGLADCYRSLKQFHKAIEIWEKYLELDDSNVTVLTRVADAYRKVHNLQESAAIYQRVLAIEDSNHYALIGLGHLYYDFKNYEQAMVYWNRMIELQGSAVDIRVLTSMGNCHRKQKTFMEGITFFDLALKRDPENFYALFGLADCHRGLDQQDRSLVFWEKILAKDPDNKVILTRAGDAWRKLGNLHKARDRYTKALELEYDPYAIIGLAWINRTEGNLEEAVRSLEGVIKNTPTLNRPYPDLMACYLSLGDQQSANRLLESCPLNNEVFTSTKTTLQHMLQGSFGSN